MDAVGSARTVGARRQGQSTADDAAGRRGPGQPACERARPRSAVTRCCGPRIRRRMLGFPGGRRCEAPSREAWSGGRSDAGRPALTVDLSWKPIWGPLTRMNDAGTASAASAERIGTSTAISGGTCEVTSGDECRSAAIRAATPSCALITLPNTCMLDARYRTRRATVPPAARIVRCHASPRETSAPICNSTLARSTHPTRQPRAPMRAPRRSPGSQRR